MARLVRLTSPPSGAAGSCVDRANARTDEVVWNDLRWLSSSNGGGAGGGGSRASIAAAALSGRAAPARRPPRGARRRGARVDAPGLAGQHRGRTGSRTRARARPRRSSPRRSPWSGRASGPPGWPPLGPVNGLLYASAPATRYDITSAGTTATPAASRRMPRGRATTWRAGSACRSSPGSRSRSRRPAAESAGFDDQRLPRMRTCRSARSPFV